MKPNKSLRILATSIAALILAQSAHGTDLYWDTNDTGANAGTTAGVWGTNAFWYTDGTGNGTGGGTATTTADDNLFFSAGTNTGATGLLNNITLLAGANLAANKITFDDPLAAATNLTLSGATSLTLGGGTGTNSGIYVSYAASSGFANRILVSQALTLGAHATFQNDSPSNTLLISGGVGTAAFNVTLKNNSTRWGGISVSGGLNNAGTVTNSGTGSGDVEINSVIGTNVTEVIQDSLTSVLTVNQSNTYTGQTTLKAGIMRIVGGTVANTGAGPFGSGGTIMFDGGIMQVAGGSAVGDPSARFNVTAGKDYRIDLHITGQNGNRDMTLATALAVNGGAGNTNGLHKFGLSKLTLTAAQTYKGTTTIGGMESVGNQTVKGGTVQIGSGGVASTGSLDPASSVAFKGLGTLNITEASGVSQSLSTLTFTAGDGTVQSTNNGGNSFLTFTTLAARGSTATMNFLTTNGTNGTDNKIVLSSVTPDSFIDKGAFYSNTAATAAANAYAWYDAGGYVRPINYASDAGAATSGATTSVASATHQQITGALSAQNSATFTSLNINGTGVSSNINLLPGATLTAGSIFKSGGTAAAIARGAGVTVTNNNDTFIIRTDDVLRINSPIVAKGTNDLVKSGASNLRLAGAINYTGDTVINDGILVLASPTDRTYSGVIKGGGGVVFSGRTTTTLNGANPHTFTAPFVVTGGTNLVLDFANMATPEQMLPQGIETNHTNNTALRNDFGQGTLSQGTQGEGSITIIGKAGAVTTVQKFGNKGQSGSPNATIAVTGTGRILVNPNGGTETLVDVGGSQMANNHSAMLIGYTASPGTGNVVFTSYRSVGNTVANGNSSMGRLYFTTDGGTTVYHTQHVGGDVNGGSGNFNRELPMEPTLGGGAYGTVTTGGASGYSKLTGAAIATAGGTFTMTGTFSGQGRNSFYKIESPQAGQVLALTGNNNFGFGALLIDGSGSGTFTISGGNIQSETTVQGNISHFAQFSSLDVNVTSLIDTTNTGGIAKFGDGRLILSNANTYAAGATRITDGILQVNAANTPGTSGPLGSATGNTTTTGLIQFSGGILQYGPSFSGTSDFSSRFSPSEHSPFKIDTNGSNVTFATALGGAAGATASTLDKYGTGTLTLTAAAGYIGNTTVKGGTLQLDTAGSLDNSLVITVGDATSSGAILDVSTKSGGFTVGGTTAQTLKGKGTITGSLTAGSLGTLSPGNSIESLDVTGDLGFSTGSLFDYELTTATLDGDLMNVTGNLTIASGVTLNLTDLGTSTATAGKLTLISYGGTWDNGTFSGYADDSQFTLGANTWTINYNDTVAGSNILGGGSGANYVTIAAVPEPGAAVSLLGGLGILLGLRRRRTTAQGRR